MEVTIVPLTVKHITFTITAKDEKERLLLRMLKADNVNTLQLLYFPLGEDPEKISFKIPNKIKNKWNEKCEKLKEVLDGQE